MVGLAELRLRPRGPPDPSRSRAQRSASGGGARRPIRRLARLRGARCRHGHRLAAAGPRAAFRADRARTGHQLVRLRLGFARQPRPALAVGQVARCAPGGFPAWRGKELSKPKSTRLMPRRKGRRPRARSSPAPLLHPSRRSTIELHARSWAGSGTGFEPRVLVIGGLSRVVVRMSESECLGVATDRVRAPDRNTHASRARNVRGASGGSRGPMLR
jgi:hypothetical protein